jgi:hypothetical protein
MRAIPRFLAPSILKSSQRGKFAPEPFLPFIIPTHLVPVTLNHNYWLIPQFNDHLYQKIPEPGNTLGYFGSINSQALGIQSFLVTLATSLSSVYELA